MRPSFQFSPNTGKYGPEITPYLDTFYAVVNLRIQSEGAKQPEITLYLNTFHSVVNLRIQTKYTKIRTRNICTILTQCKFFSNRYTSKKIITTPYTKVNGKL